MFLGCIFKNCFYGDTSCDTRSDGDDEYHNYEYYKNINKEDINKEILEVYL